MSRLLVSALASAAVIASAGIGVAAASGPPHALAPSLTSNGRVIWNLDALLNDTFGNRVDCFDAEHTAIFSVAHGSYCPSPEARYQQYDFTFLNAFHSDFRLVTLAKAPDTGATNSPLRVNGRYVSCPGGEYHHGGRGWLVFGGGAGPNGMFWCN
jgi:hypothetical protein